LATSVCIKYVVRNGLFVSTRSTLAFVVGLNEPRAASPGNMTGNPSQSIALARGGIVALSKIANRCMVQALSSFWLLTRVDQGGQQCATRRKRYGGRSSQINITQRNKMLFTRFVLVVNVYSIIFIRHPTRLVGYRSGCMKGLEDGVCLVYP